MNIRTWPRSITFYVFSAPTVLYHLVAFSYLFQLTSGLGWPAEQPSFKNAQFKHVGFHMDVKYPADKVKYDAAELQIWLYKDTPLLRRLEIEDQTRERLKVIEGIESELGRPEPQPTDQTTLSYKIKNLFPSARPP